MNIISIDPEKYNTGIFIKANNEEATMIISNPAGCTTEDAANNLYITLKKLFVMENSCQYDFGIIEGYAFNPKNRQAIIPLAEIGGVIRLAFHQNNIPLIVIPVQTWKSLTGLGKIDKQKDKAVYLQAVKTYYNKDFKTTHEADAWLMWYAVEKIILEKHSNLLTPTAKSIKTKIETIINSKV